MLHFSVHLSEKVNILLVYVERINTIYPAGEAAI